MTKQIETGQLLNELKQFTGTEQYYKFSMLFKEQLTDGMKYLCETVQCYWLMDIVGSVQNLEKIKDNNSFILWKIEVNKKDNTGVVKALSDTEGTGDLLYEQEIPYTDFPLESFEFFQCDNVIMLKGEY